MIEQSLHARGTVYLLHGLALCSLHAPSLNHTHVEHVSDIRKYRVVLTEEGFMQNAIIYTTWYVQNVYHMT